MKILLAPPSALRCLPQFARSTGMQRLARPAPAAASDVACAVAARPAGSGKANRWLLQLAALCMVLAIALNLPAAAAPEAADPPGRVGRIAAVQGAVSWFDTTQGQWAEAERNLPLTGGDRLSTAAQSRAELRVGSTVLRLGGATELEVLRLDDERMVFQLHSGSLALRVRSREIAEELELVTREARLRPLRAGHYRLDRLDDRSQAGVWQGSLRVLNEIDGPDPSAALLLETGQGAELWRDGFGGLRHARNEPLADAFSEWALLDEQQEDRRSAATRHVSPEMTGAEDLERHGRWVQHPDYGPLWWPHGLRAGWAPYRYGRWSWVSPWGWTWVDDTPWGFAPFHYGRWVHWQGRWGWWPGDYVPRPVFAPALVAWVGGPSFSVSVQVGGPVLGWVPLAPRERFVPPYRHSPRHKERINPGGPPRHRPGGDSTVVVNANVPGAVTVVQRDVLLRRHPVSRGLLEPPRGGPGQPPLQVLAGADLPVPVAPVSGPPRGEPLAPSIRPQPRVWEDRTHAPGFEPGPKQGPAVGAGRPARDRHEHAAGLELRTPRPEGQAPEAWNRRDGRVLQEAREDREQGQQPWRREWATQRPRDEVVSPSAPAVPAAPVLPAPPAAVVTPRAPMEPKGPPLPARVRDDQGDRAVARPVRPAPAAVAPPPAPVAVPAPVMRTPPPAAPREDGRKFRPEQRPADRGGPIRRDQQP